MYMSYFLSNELIFNKVNDEILSAGFGINSILLNKGLPPILSFTSNYDRNDSSSDEDDSDKEDAPVFKSFNNLAIPLGLFSLPTNISDIKNNVSSSMSNEYDTITDDMHDELLKLVEYNNKMKRQSKKNKPFKKTRAKTYKH
jgi:hypothetical protein